MEEFPTAQSSLILYKYSLIQDWRIFIYKKNIKHETGTMMSTQIFLYSEGKSQKFVERKFEPFKDFGWWWDRMNRKKV